MKRKWLSVTIFLVLVSIIIMARGVNQANALVCTGEPWQATAVYTANDLVTHNSHQWRAKWWTTGEEPGTTGQWGVWEDQGLCDGGITPTNTPPPPPTDPPPTITISITPSVTPTATGTPVTPTTQPPTETPVTTTPDPTETAVPVDGYLIELKQTSGWSGGFGAEFVINNTAATLNGWELTCTVDFTIDNMWNATWTANGNVHTFTSLEWNGEIPPGANKAIGIGGSGSLNATSARDCTLNGTAVPIDVIVSGDGSNTGGGGGILLAGVDDSGMVNQFTINQTSTDIILDTPGEDAPVYNILTNNNTIINAELIGSDTLRLTGLQTGRAGLHIKDTNSGAERFVGVRVNQANGTAPGLPEYLAVGSVSEDSVPDLTFWHDFDNDLTNKRMDVRYIYLNGGPVNGWVGWNGNINQPGGRAISFIRESLKIGMIPAFVYYNIPDGGESYFTDVQHMQDQVYMEGYFNDLKLALDIINEEAGDETVIMIFEPDFLGYLAQVGDDPLTMVAETDAAYATGILDATDPTFPNTVRGLVEAINYSVSKHAPQVEFGWQLNLWASPPGGFTVPVPGNGLIHLTDTMGMAAGQQAIYDEATAITQYYVNAGILTHGADFLSIDKYGLDAGAITGAASDPANSSWFWNNDHWLNYLKFVRAMHDTANLPVVLWQIPVGHINTSQAVSPYTGAQFPALVNTSTKYEDSAGTFFLGDTFTPGDSTRTAHFNANNSNDSKVTVNGGSTTWGNHMAETRDAGVNMVLFGAGVGASTDGVGDPATDDYWWITKVQEYYLNPVPLP